MPSPSSRAGAVALIATSIAGIAWTALELVQPSSGFDDTDSPSATLAFLAGHADVWINASFVLLLLAVTTIVATFAVGDILAQRSSPATVRTITAAGALAAACFFMFGVLRGSVHPILYIESLDRAWGEGAFLVVQMVGIHGFAQAGILAFCLWAVGVSVAGLRSGTLPRAVCLLGVIPAVRILLLLLGGTGVLEALLEALPDVLWVVGMLAIPGTFLWSLVLGVALLRRSLGDLGTRMDARIS